MTDFECFGVMDTDACSRQMSVLEISACCGRLYRFCLQELNAYRVFLNSFTMSINSVTRATSTACSKTPSYLKVVAHTAPSEFVSCLTILSLLQPVLHRIGVCLTEARTRERTCVSVSLPAVSPDTQMASGRLLNSVERAISSMGRSARYLAAYGPML